MSTQAGQYVLGHEVEHNGQQMLVVRLISSNALFEDVNKSCSIVDESYVELRAVDGTPHFATLSCTERAFAEKQSNIRGLDPLIWRPKK